ncbi:hypothetical protein ACRARH_26130 [Phytobacter ursingii]
MDLLTPEKYSDTVATIAFIVSIIAVPASGYFSYKYAIKGEKRKEWNILAVPIREKLIAQIDAMNRGEYLLAEIWRADILKLADLKRSNERDHLITAFEIFDDEHSFEKLWQVSDGRKATVSDTSKALTASKNLLELIPRK